MLLLADAALLDAAEEHDKCADGDCRDGTNDDTDLGTLGESRPPVLDSVWLLDLLENLRLSPATC